MLRVRSSRENSVNVAGSCGCAVVWFRVSADGDRAVDVMQYVVADAAQDSPSDFAKTPASQHHHRHLFLFRHINNRLTRILTELHHHPPGHLHKYQ